QLIGKLSYSWYLWHWPVLVYATKLGLAETLRQRLGWVALSFGLAFLMFRYIENPIRQHRLLLSRSRLTLALTGTLPIVCVSLSALARYGAERSLRSPEQIAYFQAAETQPAPDGCQRIYFDVDGRTCEFGDLDATWTVLLFGDSHATQWVPAFDRLGRER